MNMKTTLPGWLIAALALAGLMLPNLLRDGMFVDGLWYAAIAHNLANGIGSVWKPQLTQTLFPEFYEHPPLVFALQSVFFRAFGAGWWVERLYCAAVLLLTLWLMFAFWRRLHAGQPALVRLAFVPISLFLLHEIAYMSYPNNLLECTMGLFTLGAVWSAWQSLQDSRLRYGWLAASGLLTFLAFLCKGPTGLFPLAFPVLYALVYWRALSWGAALKYAAVITLVFAGALALLWLWEDARHHLTQYLRTQLWAALQGERTENMRVHRWHILERLLAQSAVPLAIAGLTWLIFYLRNKVAALTFDRSLAGLFLLIGLSASLPMVVSLKQASYYLVPSLPFYSMALGLLIARPLGQALEGWSARTASYRVATAVLSLSLVVALAYAASQAGQKDKRDKALLEDVYQIGEVVPRGAVMDAALPPRSYALQGYLQRYFQISCDDSGTRTRPFLLIDKSLDAWPDAGYTPWSDTLHLYELYLKQPPPNH